MYASWLPSVLAGEILQRLPGTVSLCQRLLLRFSPSNVMTNFEMGVGPVVGEVLVMFVQV